MLAVFVAASCNFRHGLPQVFKVRYGINEVPCEWAGAGRCIVCNNVLLLVNPPRLILVKSVSLLGVIGSPFLLAPFPLTLLPLP